MSRQDQIKLQDAITGSGELAGDDVLVLNIRIQLDHIAELEAEQLRTNARRPPNRHELIRLAYQTYNARRARDRMVGTRLFGEPAWDMLLALYCLPPRGEFLSVTGLSYASNVIPTTGLRWQKMLTDEGLIERGPQGVDRRKQFVRLTDSGRDLMNRLLARLYSLERS